MTTEININQPIKRLVNFKSPIFWRITAGVFTSILLIEAALLVFSWYTERARLLDRLQDSLVTVTALLDSDNPVPQLDKLIQANSQQTKFNVTGYLYESPEGARYKGGKNASLDLVANDVNRTYYSSSDNIYSTYIPRELTTGLTDKLWLQVDTSGIQAYMTTYVWRILGMVVLISIFVTGACLILLTPLLIKPLQRLNNLLVHGEKVGIRTANAQQRDLTRTDELGSVFQSFDRLRNDLIASEDANSFITERFEKFSTLGADCFWEVDRNSVFTYVSGDVKALLGMSTKDIKGFRYSAVLNQVSHRVPKIDEMRLMLKKNGVWEGEIYSGQCTKGPCTVRIAAAPYYDAAGKLAGVRGIIKDLSKETELANVLRYQATHDELTGLSNRRELTDRLNESIEKYKADRTPFVLLTLDLDRFKAINDNYGHTAGDILLKGIATSLEATVRKSDTVARVGGDEFMVLLQSATERDAIIIAEKLRKCVEEYRLAWDGEYHSVSVSIGMAEVSEKISTLESITFASDAGCIDAKNGGKNQIRTFESSGEAIPLFKAS